MIRPCTRVDEPGWLDMQFIGVDGAGRPTGFIEAAVRGDYVNGTETSPVAFVEGLYVKPEYRRQGWAASLMRAVEAWARDR